MTTPTKLREAAERLHAMSYQKTMQEHDDLHLAANTLRAIADAQTLAGEVTDKSETINTLNRRIDYVRRNWKDVDSWWREDMDNALRESLPSENSPGPSTGAPVGFAGRIEGKGRY